MKHRPQDFVFEDCFPKEPAPKEKPRVLLLPVLMLLAVAAIALLFLVK